MTTNTFTVHLFTEVRFTVKGVPANSPAEAMQLSNDAIDFHDQLDWSGNLPLSLPGAAVTEVNWTEGALLCAQVDPVTGDGTVNYDASVWLDDEGNRIEEGQSAIEAKAAAAERATRFMEELLDSVETLTGLAESHGQLTLVDLMYLHHAILTGGFIDVAHRHPGSSRVCEVVGVLPSATEWLGFIQGD